MVKGRPAAVLKCVRATVLAVDAHVDRLLLEAVSDESLGRPLTLPWATQISEALGRVPQPSTLGETCFQVTSHSTYHRGQLNTRLRDLGTEPPLVDYIAWVWFGKPRAEWGA